MLQPVLVDLAFPPGPAATPLAVADGYRRIGTVVEADEHGVRIDVRPTAPDADPESPVSRALSDRYYAYCMLEDMFPDVLNNGTLMSLNICNESVAAATWDGANPVVLCVMAVAKRL